MAGFRIEGNTSGNVVEVGGTNQLKIIPETDVTTNPGNVGGMRSFSEVDQGIVTGVPQLLSPEADNDYRLRVSQDLMLDEEVFNYTAQNTGKHSYTTATMVNAWTAGNMTTNSANTAVFSTATGTMFNTYAVFPNIGTQTLSAEIEVGFSAAPTANVFVEFGLGIPGAVGGAPTDGVFFRLSSSGMQGIASNNGTETSTGVFPATNGTGTWTYTNNKKYQFIVYNTTTTAEFWVNDGAGAVKLGRITLPTAQGRMCQTTGVQFFHKHRVTGGSSSTALQSLVGAYSVRVGGSNTTTVPSTQGSRMLGSYQGLSGGTLGTLVRVGTITTGAEANPAPALPTTTTAALGSGLGGTFWESATLASPTDGIISSYQVPAVSVTAINRRLVIRGIYLNSWIQTALTLAVPAIKEWFLAFGHTAVSLATAESATVKAPRRIVLPFVQALTSAQVAGTLVAQTTYYADFGDAPIFINPGEFVQMCMRHQNAAPTAGTIAHRITFIHGWE